MKPTGDGVQTLIGKALAGMFENVDDARVRASRQDNDPLPQTRTTR